MSTPIGNLEDITIRAIKTLLSVDLILCEDTRRTGLLLAHLLSQYGEQFDASATVKPQLVAYYEQVEEQRIPDIVDRLEKGSDVALVADAGTPLISDPGHRLVRECARRKIPVESIPGPSASLAALTSSGLPPDKFFFLGYPPEKQAHRRRLFTNLSSLVSLVSPTFILYCAPHKLARTLADLADSLGDIEVVIARELTKIHQEVWRGRLSEVQKDIGRFKGELVLLFHL